MNRIRNLLRRLRETRAVAAVEFALVLPVFLIATMGILDLSYEQYAASILQGVVQDAARDGSLEGYSGDQSELDAYIKRKVHDVWPGANVLIEREAFASFKDKGKPEKFTDTNSNGKYDKGECFSDTNGNGKHDKSRGQKGNGGAEDVVLLTATITMDRIFPGWQLIGQPPEAEVVATMTLRNQPYAAGNGGPQMICGDGHTEDDGDVEGDDDDLNLWKLLKKVEDDL
jgi:TadE-like protein